MKEPRYYLSHKLLGEVQVTKEQFIEAEKAAGFYSKTGPGTCATGGFGLSGVGISGHVRYEDAPVVVDLDAEAWNSIKQAAGEATWMPPEYTGNDWVSDVCSFLRTQGTPASRWAYDPHRGQYSGERSALVLGHYTDDELANGVYLNADKPLDIQKLLEKDPNYHAPGVWLTAAKERIRWLSRKLGEAADKAEKGLSTRLADITREARDAGYAITWWSPEEVDGVDCEAMIDVVVMRGNDYISDTREGDDDE